MITRKLNPQAILIEDIQTELKQYILDEYFKGTPFLSITAAAFKKIQAVLKQLTNETLRQVTEKSLKAFVKYNIGLLALGMGADGAKAYNLLITAKNVVGGEPIDYKTTAAGIPTQKYAKDYIKQVKSTVKEFANSQAIDTDDISGRNSLRNKAEMEVRYKDHLDRISELKNAGIRLVVCSAHADCSDRCFPFQGKVYSLDGTSGRTEDGRDYQPLENATDIYYTTKTGKSYKNGLLGFNCRHFLHEYKAGMAIPKISAATQKKENAINTKQRDYENRIRHFREEALIFREIDPMQAKRARANAIRLNKEYKRFSAENGRAFYPDRVKILKD